MSATSQAFAPPAGHLPQGSKDEATAGVVAHMAQLSSYAALGTAGLLAIWVAGTFIQGGIGNGVFAFLLSVLLFTGIMFVINKLFLAPMAAVRYGACVKSIQSTLPALGVTPAMQWAWKTPTPGVIALDTQRRLVFVQCDGTDYRRLVLDPQQIISAKVEREAEMHTQTKHSGSLSVFSSIGLGYSFGSRSRSKTSVVERAFLELHCISAPGTAPTSVVVPFGTDRRHADSMAVAITHMKNGG